MSATAERLEFAPPAAPGLLRALLLALVAHALLLGALTWGVQWKRNHQDISIEAELWAALPQEAAPPPAPEPPPAPPPKPVPTPTPQVEPPKVDIALEREKLRKEKLRQQELEKQQEKARLDKLNAEKAKADKRKLAQEKKAAEQQAKRLEAQRQQNLQRIAGLAGASGGTNATGSALKAAGPSAGYAGRIRARIKPNIVFTEDIAGNPTADVEVRTAPDGTIVGRKLLKPSGNPDWDAAVLKAIDKTEGLPRDIDGRVPSTLEISFRPKD